MVLVIGIDVGSTTTKAVLLEAGPQPRELAVGRAGTPDDPDGLVDTVATVLREVVAGAADPIAAVGIASMAETGAAFDAAGGALTPLLRWDRAAARGVDLAAMLAAHPDLPHRTGLPATPKPTRVALRALRREHPTTFSRLERWSGAADLVATALTGRHTTDRTLAARTMLLDRGATSWSAAALDDLDLPADALPRILAPGEAAGTVTAAAAATTGLPVGVPVHLAGHDHAVAAWGAGVRTPGDVLDSLGTAEAVMTVTGEADAAAVADGFAVGRTVDDRFDTILGGSAACGALLAGWTGDAVTELATLPAERWSTRRAVVLPYPAGRQCPLPDAAAMLRVIGTLAGEGGTDALQALILHAQWMRAALARHAGRPAERLIVLGSLAHRIPVWAPLAAAAAGLPTRRSEASEPVAAAAALLAAVRADLVDARTTLPAAAVVPAAASGLDAALRRLTDAAALPAGGRTHEEVA